jgi:lipopolysaccharide export system permease protein
VALKAGGVGIFQMLRAPALFSFLCMCLGLVISLHAISWGMNNFRSTILHIANTRAKVVVQPGVFNKDIFGLTLFARQVDPVSGKLHQVIFEDTTQKDASSVTVLAPEGEIITDADNGNLVFIMHNGRIYRVDKENVSILEFAEYTVRLDLNKLFASVDLGDVKPKEMPWETLLAMHQGKNAPSARFQNKVAVEIQKRLALPAACLVLGLFALPLACAFEGVKRQLGIVLALAMFLLYYSLFSLGLSTGESGLVPPVVGLWAANILFAVGAVIGLRQTNRERMFSFRGLGAWLREAIAALSGRRKGARREGQA